jgi:succinate dehydrogenase/fumarate reductase flavoprotein subunit
MERDVVIVGSGGGGLTAAITAAKAGLDVLVVEKTEYFGGTTALSGGGIWIPGNSLAAREGSKDTAAAGARYIRNLVGAIVHEDILEAFVGNGAAMVDFLHANSEVRFALHHNEPDYFQELDGATLDGRLMSPVNFDGRSLGPLLPQIRPPLKEFNAPLGFMISFADIPHLMNVGKSLKSTVHVLKLVARYRLDLLRYPRGTHLTMGNALIARLLQSAATAGVTLWLRSPLTRLISEGGRVTGIEVQREGQTQTIRARRGVVLASGGFSASLEMRRQFLPYADQHVSLLPDGNTGDSLRSALSLGAEFDVGNHADAAYTVVSVLHKPDGTLGKYPHVFMDRPKPGCIAVNSHGKRFGNEADADFVKAMHRTASVPAHLICDHRFIKKYGLGLVFPGGTGLNKLIKAGYIITDDTLAGLATKIGADGPNLQQTVAASNRYAAEGSDPEFHKGDSPVNRALGDGEHTPNPCLGPIDAAPFYAVKIFPGDGSTMLGLKTNASAQVLNKNSGQPMPGLYACGLDMNALWRGLEPSHGSYNALAMTFGYVAANHIAASHVATDLSAASHVATDLNAANHVATNVSATSDSAANHIATPLPP